MGNATSTNPADRLLPIDTIFKFPSPLPTWPPGDGFGSGKIDLGGLEVSQITSFTRIWATYEGGPDNMGATFYEPSPIPDGFSMLGSYSQPNNQPLFGWVLVAKDNPIDDPVLANPTDYTLVWSSTQSPNISQDGPGYIWLPTPPDGYRALGHVVTTEPEKPPLDKIQCVRSDLTEEAESENWIWGEGTQSTETGLNVYGLRPTNRGTRAQGVSVGTFVVQNNTNNSSPSLACLKNNNFNLSSSSSSSSMPNLTQIQALLDLYSPLIYYHPDESYLPASVNWYFSNGTLIVKQGEESNPGAMIEPNGSNLPQGGSNDGTYWIDLPVDENARERVKKGDLQSSEAYLNIKPMLGATFTDIAVWIFYPFNGPATAKLGLIDIPLGVIGEHIGDWEHLTMRISNFNGVLHRVYFSQHSGGTWIDAPLLEFQEASNKVVAYSSKSGHAFYSKPGVVLQGAGDIGLKNETEKSELVMDIGERYSIISGPEINVEPAWVNYLRKWGPTTTYQPWAELQKVKSFLAGDQTTAFDSFLNLLPDSIFGEDGPTGPKVKNSWTGDEV